jgi:membrane protein required for colicin V production
MEGFTLVDGVVLAVVVLSAVLAYARGLVREMLSIAGWIAAAIAAFVFAPSVEPLTREIPVLRDIIGTSCELGVLVAFAIVFAVALIIVSLFTPLLAGAVQNSALGPIDQGLGLLFGVARGIVLVVIALIVYRQVMGENGGVEMVDASRSRAMLAGVEAVIAGFLPEDAPQWIAGQFDRLTAGCS